MAFPPSHRWFRQLAVLAFTPHPRKDIIMQKTFNPLVDKFFTPFLLCLALLLVSGCGGFSSGSGNSNKRVKATLDQSFALITEFHEAQERESWKVARDAGQRFSNLDISFLPRNYQSAHKEFGSAMIAFADVNIEVERNRGRSTDDLGERMKQLEETKKTLERSNKALDRKSAASDEYFRILESGNLKY